MSQPRLATQCNYTPLSLLISGTKICQSQAMSVDISKISNNQRSLLHKLHIYNFDGYLAEMITASRKVQNQNCSKNSDCCFAFIIDYVLNKLLIPNISLFTISAAENYQKKLRCPQPNYLSLYKVEKVSCCDVSKSKLHYFGVKSSVLLAVFGGPKLSFCEAISRLAPPNFNQKRKLSRPGYCKIQHTACNHLKKSRHKFGNALYPSVHSNATLPVKMSFLVSQIEP